VEEEFEVEVLVEEIVAFLFEGGASRTDSAGEYGEYEMV
jgi:hypothetical protein